ncbi:hypothetical protein [Yoonia sp. SS1-5]|uniref:ASCH domain-containing protein n=1 Tax=Yoonia rhodophyticola TaxID=3137370 RepID=A0AAN0M6P0_9RHOB
MVDLPSCALSVRQPWAWAIVAGHKKIENRSAGSIRAGGMTCRRIAIHAASGLKQDEYDWGAWRLARHGLDCPRPDQLVRGAIIGAVDVVDIVSESDSEWFGGQMGLVLDHAAMCDPIPAKGALGYFTWERAASFAPVSRWMREWGGGPSSLFDDLPLDWRNPPRKPFGG